MTLPLDLEAPSAVTRPADGLTPDGTSLPSGTAGAVGNEKKPAGLGESESSYPVTPTALAHVIGLDVSLTATGVACTHGATTILSNGKKDATLSQRQQRLRHIAELIIGQVGSCGTAPDLVIIEGPSFGSRDGSAHDRAGLWWWLIRDLSKLAVRVIEIPPSTRAKFITGKGNASKDTVLAAAIKRLPIDVANNNEADAAVLAAIGHDLLGQPICDLPALNRAAIDKHRPSVLPPAPKDA